MLGLTQTELAGLAGVSIPTLKRVEGTGIGPVSPRAVALVRTALERQGVVFIDADGELGPGVRQSLPRSVISAHD